MTSRRPAEEPEPPHGDADVTPEEAPRHGSGQHQILAALKHLVPPHNLDLEREVLGAMMFTAENDAAIVAVVRPTTSTAPRTSSRSTPSSPCINGTSRRPGSSSRMSCGGEGTSKL